MGNIIVFNKTVKGASHILSGKPCQDHSLVHNDNETFIAIVCDGHGSETYVRSDKGSKFAGDIALQKILEFSATPSFLQHLLTFNNAVTAAPRKNPLNGKVKYEDLEESEQQIVQQNEQYKAAIQKDMGQNELFVKLFSDIYQQWKIRITEDEKENPFNEKEKKALNGFPIEKAYGTTLMAFVRTPYYWFAFHIGDGKMLACDRNLKWSEPVPWDYKCFLNITTSLCDDNPIPEFRYAFSGKGDFPVAVFLGSDGIDDSYFTPDSLHNFYSQVLLFLQKHGKKTIEEEMGIHLTNLSGKASRDDMSIAAIVDMDAIKNGVEIFEINQQGNKLKKDKDAKIKHIGDVKNKKVSIDEEIEKLTAQIDKLKKDKLNTENVEKLEADLEKWKKDNSEKIKELSDKRIELENKNAEIQLKENAEWQQKIKSLSPISNSIDTDGSPTDEVNTSNEKSESSDASNKKSESSDASDEKSESSDVSNEKPESSDASNEKSKSSDASDEKSESSIIDNEELRREEEQNKEAEAQKNEFIEKIEPFTDNNKSK